MFFDHACPNTESKLWRRTRVWRTQKHIPRKKQMVFPCRIGSLSKRGKLLCVELKNFFPCHANERLLRFSLDGAEEKKLFLPFSFHKFLFSLLPSSDRQRDVYSADPSFLFPDFYRVLNWREKKEKKVAPPPFLPRVFMRDLFGRVGGVWGEKKTSGKRGEEEGGNNNILFLTLFAPESFYPGNSEKKLCFPAFLNMAHILLAFFLWHTPDPKMITGCGGGFFRWLSAGAFCVPISPPKFLFTGKQGGGRSCEP